MYSKDEIKDALMDKVFKQGFLSGRGGSDFVFIDGFTNMPVYKYESGEYKETGKSIPAVTVIEKKTSRIFQFSLAALFSED